MITRVSHIGLRVLDADRSLAFYRKLGFELVWSHPTGEVLVLKNAAGVELNLIVNAVAAFDGTNVLMDDDLPKRAGYTHLALVVASIDEAIAWLGELGIPISGGPERLGSGLSLFVRDPDRNVVELRQEVA